MLYFRRIYFEPQCSSEAIAVCAGCRSRYRLVGILEVDVSEVQAGSREVVKANHKAMLERARTPGLDCGYTTVLTGLEKGSY